jgi:tetratricopeptide (TPR) repeat protein
VAAGFAALLFAGVILATNNPVGDFAQEKLMSLRYRAAELLPQPTPPPLMPTPVQIVITFLTAPAPTYTPILPSPTAVPPTPVQQATAALPTATPVPPAPPAPTPAVALAAMQPAVIINGITHEHQGWNNCGPTTLKMYLGFYGRADTQKGIATFTKPDPDDKNVSPNELTDYVAQTELNSIARQNGTLDLLKRLLSNGLPVMIESGYVTPDGKEGWMGHYKLLYGYDDASAQFTFMDSYEGPARTITFDQVDADWKAFNRLYLIVYPDDKADVVRAIVGADMDDATMYTQAAARARAEIAANAQDAFAYFNLGSSLNGLQQYTDAAAAYDQARMLGLPWRMLWYQFGPYVAYQNAGRYGEVITLADSALRVLDDLEESHYYKGLALRALKREDEARREFETALRYNKNFAAAQQALQGAAG